MKIHAIGYHDMFSLRYGGLENLTIVEIDGKTLAIEAPSHITGSLPNIQGIGSDSKITKTDALIVTHIDADHTSGFDYLLWSKVFEENSKLLLITHKEVADQLWQRIRTAFEISRINMKTKMKMEDYISLIELKFGEITPVPYLGIGVETFRRSTKHAPFISIAFKVWKNEEIVLAYSGDTSFDPELIGFLAKGGDHPITHEAGSYSAKSPSHTSVDELLALPDNIQRRIYMNHLPWILKKEIMEKIKKADSPLRLAHELA